MRPRRLSHFLARQKFDHHGFDVDYRRTVDRIEFGHEDPCAFDFNDSTDRSSYTIRAVLSSLRKDANGGQLRVVSGMAGTINNLYRLDLVEKEHHLDMGKVS